MSSALTYPDQNPASRWKIRVLWLIFAWLPALHASKEVPIIGLSMDTLALDRWQKDRDTFVATVESLGGRVIIENANSVDAMQIKQIQGLAERGVDVIVIVPHDATALSGVIKSVNGLNIPVISYDRLILNADITCYLSFDNVKVGEAQASYVAAHVPTDRKARIVRICGAATDNNAKLFKQGQDNVLTPLIAAGKIEIVHEDWAKDWKPEEARRIMRDALTMGGSKIDAVLASNDATAGGAIEVMMEDGLPHTICVTGQDADRAACVRIKAGSQSMTIYKPLPKLAIRAAQVAIDIAKGNPLKTATTIDNGLKAIPAIFEEIIAVDRSNIDGTVVSDGFLRSRK
jgi:D-xylose transport system substrate-binding protein